MNPLFLIAAATAAFALYKTAGAGQAAKLLQYEIKSLHVENINLLSLKMKVVFGIINPTTTQLQFSSFIGDLMDGDTLVTTIATKQTGNPIKINPNATTNIPIVFTISNSTILSELTSLLEKKTKKSKPKAYSIVGILKFGSIEIPVNQTVSLSK